MARPESGCEGEARGIIPPGVCRIASGGHLVLQFHIAFLWAGFPEIQPADSGPAAQGDQAIVCGIVAIFHPRDMLPVESMARAINALSHRGPDSSGLWVDPSSRATLGHTRLAIQDLTPAGHQPMVSASGRFVISFNGEIYNHLSLRREIEVGVPSDQVLPGGDQSMPQDSWRGHSDTETLLACIERWGMLATLEKVNGMFAFALWDRENLTLSLARDRMGEKPIYFGYLGSMFVAASEIQAISSLPGFERRIDRGSVDLLMSLGSIPAPYCIYEGYAKLEPGSYLTLSLADAAKRQSPRPIVYWSAIESARESRGGLASFGNDASAVDELDSRLRSAIRGQMISDVPLGAFLSGGIDSSVVVSLMQAESQRAGADPVRTYSVGFEESDYNEAEDAKAVAGHLGTTHRQFYLGSADCLAAIRMMPSIYSEPFADSSQIPTYLVARLARSEVSVALSGDGGDELFGGYNRYQMAARFWPALNRLPVGARQVLAGALRRLPIDSILERLSALVPADSRPRQAGEKIRKITSVLDARDGLDLYRRLVTHWVPQTLSLGAVEYPTRISQRWPLEELSLPEQMMLMDTITWLPDDILVKVDRAAMAVSLETRIPFLDRDVVGFAQGLPLRYKLRGGVSKWILRQLLYRYVPRELVERPKSGFVFPLAAWLRGPLRDWAEDLLDAAMIHQDGFLDGEKIRRAWTAHLGGRTDMSALLWPVLMFQSWNRHASAR